MSKGKRNQRLARKIYEAAGYKTFTPQESKFGETDMFGLFDIVAVHQEYGLIRWVQVKTNGASGIEAWQEEAIGFAFQNSTVELVTRYDGHGGPHPDPARWRLVMPFADPTIRHETMLDERNQDLDADGESLIQYLDPERPDP